MEHDHVSEAGLEPAALTRAPPATGRRPALAAGNAALARAVAARATLARDGEGGAPAVATPPAPVAVPGSPGVTVPGAPPSTPGGDVVGTVHEGARLTNDYAQVREVLEHSIETRGWQDTYFWTQRFLTPANPIAAVPVDSNADDMARIRKVVRDELEIKENSLKLLVGDPVIDAGDLRVGGGTFEPAALATTNLLLDTSEKQLKEESKHYGLEVSGLVFKDYSTTSGGPLQAGMQTAAKELAQMRWKANDLRAKFMKAQDRLNDPKLTIPGVPIADPTDEARKEWIAAEDAFRARAGKEQATYPVLAAYTTPDDAEERLTELSTQNTDQLAENLYKTIEKRLANIETVRENIGSRYSIWKQPQIVALTKKTQGLKPWESRMVDAKVNQVKADEKADAELWAAVAMGIGMLGAIPTGGAAMAGSVALAGMVTAASTLGAVYSMRELYEHYKDYELGTAAADTALDPEDSISKDAPGLTWLARDLIDLGLNALAAKGAFDGLLKAVNLAKESKLAALPQLRDAIHAAGLGEASEAKLVQQTIAEAGGASVAAAELVGLEVVHETQVVFGEATHTLKAVQRDGKIELWLCTNCARLIDDIDAVLPTMPKEGEDVWATERLQGIRDRAVKLQQRIVDKKVPFASIKGETEVLALQLRNLGAKYPKAKGLDYFKVWHAATDYEGTARRMGFTRVPGEISHGQPVYTNGNRFISPDIDGHNGGVWKAADTLPNLGRRNTRQGTYNFDLTKRVGD